MEDNSLEIINLYKHNIVYKTMHKKLSVKNFTFVFVFLLVTAVFYSINFINAEFYETLQTTMSNVYNPVNPLYNEHGGIFFTSSKALQYNGEREVSFSLPVLSIKIEYASDYIEFTVGESVIIAAVDEGVVESVTTNEDGTKTVVIKHSKSISSKYVGLDIVGIVPGDIVKAGQELATGRVGSVVRFYVLKNGKPVTNLTISENKITWQD